MGRAPCCDKAKVKRGPWSSDEDTKLRSYIQEHGTGGNWIALPQKIGLKRCGKSCRLRWLNYLRPNIKHGGFSDEEDNVICALYLTIGSRWSIIAAQLPGRTDNDIKNYWNTKLKKKLLNKQRTEIQEAARRSKTTYTNSNNIVIKRENYITAEATSTVYDHDQYRYWPQQYQLPAMAIDPSPSQHQNNIINVTTSNFHIHPENISTLNDFEDQFYGNLDFSSISTMPPINNYTTCFESFNNFGINEIDEKTVYSMEKICSFPSGVETVNGGSISGTTSTSAESTVSWGGDHMNPNFVCSPMVSMISYEDADRHRPQEIMQCAFEDHHQQQQQQYLGFHQ